MDNKTTVTMFVSRTLFSFSLTILFVVVVGSFLGDGAKAASTLFALGAQGITYTAVWQALALSLYATTVRTIFMSELVFKKMMLLWRTIWMFVLILAGIGLLSVAFGWIPGNEPLGWIMYVACFGTFSGVSALVMVLKTRYEDARVNRKLAEYKKQKLNDVSPGKGE